MYSATIIAAAAAMASTVSALPSALQSRSDCSTNPAPWFINTQPDTGCVATGTPQISSGPAPGRTATCETLQGSWGAVAASVAGNQCGSPFTLTFYTTTDCSDAGTTDIADSTCVGAPAGAQFVAFSATPGVAA